MVFFVGFTSQISPFYFSAFCCIQKKNCYVDPGLGVASSFPVYFLFLIRLQNRNMSTGVEEELPENSSLAQPEVSLCCKQIENNCNARDEIFFDAFSDRVRSNALVFSARFENVVKEKELKKKIAKRNRKRQRVRIKKVAERKILCKSCTSSCGSVSLNDINGMRRC